jgi:3-oxoacyl-[acyl-carrier protein] reductase/meso-butanediol dehydrogenase/(S,S)-butanediol dehydrogenase/diacetyl reductase
VTRRDGGGLFEIASRSENQEEEGSRMTGRNEEPVKRGRWCPELQGRTAIITGAGRYRSIGRQIALELARQGVNILLTGTGRSPSSYPQEEQEIGWQDIASVVGEIEALGAQGLAMVSDVSDPEAVDAVVNAAINRFGGVDILINNAGATVGEDRVPLFELDIEQWQRVIRINLDGAFYMARAAAREMVARGHGGTIINISSIGSRLCSPTSGAYAASKAGLNAMSRVMALELAKHRITVNALLPGIVMTSRISSFSEREDFDEALAALVPLGVPGDGTEIANMCTYLASDMGNWITGQDITVDGGQSWH